jgi:uracil-DNA glycosylase
MHHSNLDWNTILSEEFTKPYFTTIQSTITKERELGIEIYPPKELVNNAFKLAPFSNIKVVILGQDPYHNIGQAHGLSFSVPTGIKPPPSLMNIYKELRDDCNITIPSNGNLESWAKQGVFLLNSVLTVQAHQPASHSKLGWQKFTDYSISAISDNLENVVFMLWGNYAIQKSILIDERKHLILLAAHPSPFSAYRGFLGCRHFSKANEYLESKGIDKIKWDTL